MKITDIAYIAIPVSDLERAKKFYEGVLGLRESARFMEGNWVEYGTGEGTVAIVKMDGWNPSENGQSVALEVDDFDRAIKELRAAETTFLYEPFDSPTCRMAVVRDPDGNGIIIHRVKATEQSPHHD